MPSVDRIETVNDRDELWVGILSLSMTDGPLNVRETVASSISDASPAITAKLFLTLTKTSPAGSKTRSRGICGRTRSWRLLRTVKRAVPCVMAAESVATDDGATPAKVTVESFTPGGNVTAADIPPTEPLTPPYDSCTTTLDEWYKGGMPRLSAMTRLLLTYTKPLPLLSIRFAGIDKLSTPFGTTTVEVEPLFGSEKTGAADPERTIVMEQADRYSGVNVNEAVAVDDDATKTTLLTLNVPQLDSGVTTSVLVAYGGGIDRTTETVIGAPMVAVAGTPLQLTVSRGRTTTERVAGDTV